MEVFVLHILKLNIIAAVEICYLADRGSQPDSAITAAGRPVSCDF